MINFTYTAKRADTGEIVKAEVQAQSEQAAAKLLIDQQLFPITITKKQEGSLADRITKGGKVKAKDRVIFTRQMATLINAGLPLTQSLRTVQTQISNKNLQSVIAKVVASVEGGASLAEAFTAHPKVFNQTYVSLVAAGEASGSLDKTMERIAMQQEKDAAIASKIRGALLYPAIVLVIIILVLGFMLTTVVPQVAGLYKDLNRELPLPTKVLMALSNFIVHQWWLAIIALVGGGYGARAYFKTVRGKRALDQFKIKVPIFGKLLTKVYMARFSRTMGSLLATGIPMLRALEIVKDAINNIYLSEAIERAMEKVKGGKPLSTALESEPLFLILVPQMIKIGEQSGKIDEMLDRLAGSYESEVDDEVRNLSTTIEPIMMVLLGLIVGGVIVAVLLPVYSLVGSGALSGAK